MKLSINKPRTWRELQDRVAELLRGAGFRADSPKVIDTARGRIEVDVFVESNHDLLKTFVCECKNWNSRVPKEKVHAFRQVVQDCGAMLGLFISSKGFQKGAIEASAYSNVILLTWDDFLKFIEKRWVMNNRIKLERVSYPLRRYTNILQVETERMSPTNVKRFYSVCEKYIPLCMEIMANIAVNGASYLIEAEEVKFAGTTHHSIESFFDSAFLVVHQGIMELKSIIPPCNFDWDDHHSLPMLLYLYEGECCDE